MTKSPAFGWTQPRTPSVLALCCAAGFTSSAGRHFFATTCIENGVDIPTVSKWLVHKNGGALAMKLYGHLRQEHSFAMIKRVNFGGQTAENVVGLPKPAVA